ncbi:MAG: AAA-like domain-containing protein [Phormidesmis sp.]
MPADKTILILAANPSDTTRLRLPEEVREIEAGLNLSTGRDRFNLISQGAVRPEDLRRSLLKHQPQVVHFSGHGAGEQGLIFEDDHGQAKPISTDALARLFGLCPSVECVLLNACYSQVQAQAIGQHVEYVVGMNDAIGDRAAIKFAVGFYDALGYGRSVPEAYEFGLAAIDLDGIDETATPVLLVRGVASKGDAGPDVGPDLALEEPEGLVPVGSPFYMERSPIETDCYETVIRPGSLIRIKAPRQMGKTSLLVRTLDWARSQGFKTVRLSFQEADTQTLDDLDELKFIFPSASTAHRLTSACPSSYES